MDTVINQSISSKDGIRGLALETSSMHGSAALVDGPNILPEQTFPQGLKHAAGLLPLIDQMLKDRSWKPTHLNYLFVSEGPGSFTGLRIGITLAKTLAMATGSHIVAVSTMRVLAANAPAEAKHVVTVLDAKQGQIFTSRFERVNGDWIEREPAHVDSLNAMLQRSPRPVHLIGEGIPYREAFLPADRTGIIITPETLWRPLAANVAQLGLELAAQNQLTDIDKFVPVYLRKSEAEEKYDLQENA